ncbi:MAG: prohibitin family protein, partial [Ignavibacteria bacterium]|nr:prohibitin family protein [Ignavibacteria bacterium]
MLFIFALLIIAISYATYVNLKKAGRYKESKFAFAGYGIGALIILFKLFTVVPAGTVGVVDFLGNVSDNTLKAGVNFVNPLANVVKFSIKTQEIKETMNVPSMEGLSVQLEISLLYSLDPDNASKIYKTVGEDYANIILIPQFRSVVRGVTSKYDAKALYTASRELLSLEIKKELEKLVGPRGITIEFAPMRQIMLPQGLTAAIEEKLKSEQESQRMQFVLKREEQEADRKRIEAQGIADFQTIVSR